jgi:ParB-like chromosome segregation protein Spo0J
VDRESYRREGVAANAGPITVVENGSGGYSVIEGGHRVMALKKLKEEGGTVPDNVDCLVLSSEIDPQMRRLIGLGKNFVHEFESCA